MDDYPTRVGLEAIGYAFAKCGMRSVALRGSVDELVADWPKPLLLVLGSGEEASWRYWYRQMLKVLPCLMPGDGGGGFLLLGLSMCGLGSLWCSTGRGIALGRPRVVFAKSCRVYGSAGFVSTHSLC